MFNLLCPSQNLRAISQNAISVSYANSEFPAAIVHP
jgi:hypothetical protein